MLKTRTLLGFSALVVLLVGGCAGPLQFFDRPDPYRPPALSSQDDREEKKTPLADTRQEAEKSPTRNVAAKPTLDDAEMATAKIPDAEPSNTLFSHQELQGLLKDVDPSLHGQFEGLYMALRDREQRIAQTESTDNKPETDNRADRQDERPPVQTTQRDNRPAQPKQREESPQQPDDRQNPRLDDSPDNQNRLRPNKNSQQSSDTDNRDIADKGKVVFASHDESVKPKLGDWKQELGETIRAVEEHMRNQQLEEDDRARLETYLRLLYVVDEQRENALKPIIDLDKNEQAFWKEQIFGLTENLNTNGIPLADRRATVSLRHLRKANSHLAAISSLDVRNLAFCTKINNYGQYTEFSATQFKPNQELLLYVEIDNFAVAEHPQGFETVLKGSYQIFDSGGRRVADHTFSPLKEICRNRRRDFFIPYRVYLPKTIPAGDYTLKLTVEDDKAEKFGQGEIQFSIK